MLPGPHAVVGGLGDDDAGGGGAGGQRGRRAGQLGQVAAVDGERADGTGLALVDVESVAVGAKARVDRSAGHRVSVVPQLGAVRAYLCGDFRDRGG
jgi:hypothetical protein